MRIRPVRMEIHGMWRIKPVHFNGRLSALPNMVVAVMVLFRPIDFSSSVSSSCTYGYTIYGNLS